MLLLRGDATQPKSIGWTSTYISRSKNLLHSIADHVSQVWSFFLVSYSSFMCSTYILLVEAYENFKSLSVDSSNVCYIFFMCRSHFLWRLKLHILGVSCAYIWARVGLWIFRRGQKNLPTIIGKSGEVTTKHNDSTMVKYTIIYLFLFIQHILCMNQVSIPTF
jgi:hypothetical protein